MALMTFQKPCSMLPSPCASSHYFTRNRMLNPAADPAGLVLSITVCFPRIIPGVIRKTYGISQKTKVMHFFRRQNSLAQQRKTHRIYTCPQCRQKIRDSPKDTEKCRLPAPMQNCVLSNAPNSSESRRCPFNYCFPRREIMFGYITVNQQELKIKRIQPLPRLLLWPVQILAGASWHSRTDDADL